jgi:hypothetical protein
MKITEAEYITIDDNPFLRLVIDEKEALVGDLKGLLLDDGYVPLISRHRDVDWSQILPPIVIRVNEETFTLYGCTDDPVIVKMALNYWKAVNDTFVEGPINIESKS